MKTFFIRSMVLGAVVLSLLLLPAKTARAAGTWYVTTTGSDANACDTPDTPCASVNAAMSKGGFVAGDSVKIEKGYYFGTGNQVVLVDKNVTLSGGWDADFLNQTAQAIFDGEQARRGLTMIDDTVTLDHIGIQNGLDVGGGGGGIYNYNGKLTLQDSFVVGNVSPEGANTGQGGGIYSLGSQAELTLNDSTVSDNYGFNGGGMLVGGMVHINRSQIFSNGAGASTGTGGSGGAGIAFIGPNMVINDSTVSHNFVHDGYDGSGIRMSSGLLVMNNSTVSNNDGGDGISKSSGTLILRSVTVTRNEGVGVNNQFGTAELANTLLAHNKGGDCANGFGILTSDGYNLAQTPGSCAFNANDLTNLNPFIGLLNPHGGAAYTVELYNRSPAIDAGNPNGCTGAEGNPLSVDQRGFGRVGRCDIGAFEYDPTVCESAVPFGPDLHVPEHLSTVRKRKVLFQWWDQNCVTSFTLEVHKNSKKGVLVLKKENLLIAEVKSKIPTGAGVYWYRVKECFGTVCSKSMWYKFTYQPK